MAQPTTIRHGKFKIYVEDPNSAGTYIAPCAFTEKALTLAGSPVEDVIPDCDNPDAPAWVGRSIGSLSASVSASGLWAAEAYETWRTLFLAGEPFNVRVEFDETGANGGGYYAGAAVLTSLGNSSSQGKRVEASVELASDGAWTWTAAA